MDIISIILSKQIFLIWGLHYLFAKSIVTNIMIALLILFAFGFIIIFIFTVNIRKQRESLEDSINQRTDKLTEQSKEIEEISKKLKEKDEEINKAYLNQKLTEKKFNFILNNASEGIGLTDNEGKLIFANSTLCRILGYNHEEIINLYYTDFLRPENRKEANQAIKLLINKKIKQVKIEREFIRKDNTTFWVNFSGSPLLDDNNEVIGLIGISTDINAIKKQEFKNNAIVEELKTAYKNITLLSEIGQKITQHLSPEDIISVSYKNLNRILDATVFAIMTHNKQTNKLDVFGGIEKGEKLPHFFYDLDKDKSLATLCFTNQEEIIIQNYEEEYSKYLPERSPPKAGEDASSIFYTPLSIKDQNLGVFTIQSFKTNAYSQNDIILLRNVAIYISIALQNSDTLTKLENQNNEIEYQSLKLQIANKEFEKLSIVANKTNNAVVIMDNKGNFDWVNEGFANLYETTLDEFIIEKGINIFNINKSEKIGKIIKKCFEQNIHVDYEFHEKTKSGKKIWVQTNLTPIQDDNGKLYKVVAIDTDISRIKEAELRLNHQKAQIEKAYNNIQLLSEIGKEVTSSLAIEKIIHTIHNQINQFMDAPIIGLGLHNLIKQSLDFVGKENIKSDILRSTDLLKEKKKLSVVCFMQQKEIYIGDYEKQKTIYEHYKQITLESESQSLVYIPLTVKDKKIGVMTVQSLLKEAYTEYQINILKNIAVYAGIALENSNTVNQLETQKEEIAQQKEELQLTLNNLERTQDQLVESAKMAALGNLVAGIAHEINTPVGVGLVASSTLLRKSEEIIKALNSNTLTKEKLSKFLKSNLIASELIYNNLERTGELVKSFKQVSVDQSSEKKRTFNIRSYIDDVVRSLHPKLKNRNIEINIDCQSNLEIESFPGVFAQIFTNLIINSLTHAFTNEEKGLISLEINKIKKDLLIEYSDNGKGIKQEDLPYIFDPFFTTNMTEGSGLGMHIIYNLITQKLKGTIDCMSKPNEGVYFIIKVPYN
jgi:PAS domain S-box-containing protein